MDRAVSYVNTIFSIDDPAPGDHIASDDYINYVHNMTSSIVDGSFFHLPEVHISLSLQLHTEHGHDRALLVRDCSETASFGMLCLEYFIARITAAWRRNSPGYLSLALPFNLLPLLALQYVPELL